MLMTVLIVLLVLSLFGGGFGQGRIGYVSWSPLGVFAVILLVLLFTGHRW